MAPVIELSRQDLLERQDAILAHLGVTLDVYRERAATHLLSSDEWAVMDDLDSILFLLGEETLTD